MTTQDSGVLEPRARLRTVLALLRILAGRRGWATVAWSGAGFRYTLSLDRLDRTGGVEIDADPGDGLLAGDVDAVAARLREHLEVTP